VDEPDPSSVPVRPRFFAASLSDHNNGVLHGTWIDASADTSTMQFDVDAMLQRSPTYECLGEPAEAWLILDSEGFDELLDPHTSLTEVASKAEPRPAPCANQSQS
jgi:hypothetical protein